MESPTISRSPSATFAPNRGRRSHTNVHHLSLAPLTPKYPIDISDYDAYFDPQTSQLHTSGSLTHVSGLPSPGGILSSSPAHSRTNSRGNSRANSRTRAKRRNKSSVSIQDPTIPSGALTSQGFGETKAPRGPTDNHSSSRLQNDASWLVQTGLTLTEGSRESKGQSWIVKRASSTSLNTAEDQTVPTNGRATPRNRSRRRSKKSLAMTPAMITPIDDAEPMWADAQSQHGNESDYDRDREDVYNDLDFDQNFSSDDDADEEEVRQAISRYRLGQWVDNWVDVMLKLEDEVSDEDDAQQTDVEVEAPPVAAKGVWDDFAWFGRLVARTVKS